MGIQKGSCTKNTKIQWKLIIRKLSMKKMIVKNVHKLKITPLDHYKPINIYKWKLDYITFPTKKGKSGFIEPCRRYDKI